MIRAALFLPLVAALALPAGAETLRDRFQSPSDDGGAFTSSGLGEDHFKKAPTPSATPASAFRGAAPLAIPERYRAGSLCDVAVPDSLSSGPWHVTIDNSGATPPSGLRAMLAGADPSGEGGLRISAPDPVSGTRRMSHDAVDSFGRLLRPASYNDLDLLAPWGPNGTLGWLLDDPLFMQAAGCVAARLPLFQLSGLGAADADRTGYFIFLTDHLAYGIAGRLDPTDGSAAAPFSATLLIR